MDKLDSKMTKDLKMFIEGSLRFKILDKKSGEDSENSIINKGIHQVQFEYKVDIENKSPIDEKLIEKLSVVLGAIRVEKLHRLKVNITFPSLTYNKADLVHTEELVKGCKSCVLFLSTNDGAGTKIEDGDFFPSIEGNYHIFDTYLRHYGIPNKEGKARCVINIVYSPKE